MSEKCVFTKEDGNRCNAWSLKDSTFCFTHDDPENARLAGAMASAPRDYEIPELTIDDADDLDNAVIAWLQEIILNLRKSKASDSTARALTTAVVSLDNALARRSLLQKDQKVPYELIWPD